MNESLLSKLHRPEQLELMALFQCKRKWYEEHENYAQNFCTKSLRDTLLVVLRKVTRQFHWDRGNALLHSITNTRNFLFFVFSFNNLARDNEHRKQSTSICEKWHFSIRIFACIFGMVGKFSVFRYFILFFFWLFFLLAWKMGALDILLHPIIRWIHCRCWYL